jgi:hypothetical protein
LDCLTSGVNERTHKNGFSRIGFQSVEWIHQVRDVRVDKCWALVNTVMNLGVHLRHITSGISERLLTSQEGFYCMEIFSYLQQRYLCMSVQWADM